MPNYTASNPVAQQIANELGLSGKTYVVIISVLMGASRQVRLTLYNYLTSQRQYISLLTSNAKLLAQKGDVVAQSLGVIVTVMQEFSDAMSSVFRTSYIDPAILSIPEVSDLFKSISESVPLKIPATWATQLTGIAGFDFFDGITSFHDLQERIEELEFRIARSLSLSTYADTTTYFVNNQLDKIDTLLNVLNTLEIKGL